MTIPTPYPPHKMRHSQGVSVLEKVTETMRVTGPNGESLWVQNGRVYNDAGQVVEEQPAWLSGEFAKMSKYMQRVHKLLDGEEALEPPEDEKLAELRDLEGMTKAQLLKIAEAESVSVSQHDTRRVLINKILDRREQ